MSESRISCGSPSVEHGQPGSPVTIRMPTATRRISEPDSSDDESSNPGTPDLRGGLTSMREMIRRELALNEEDEILMYEEEVTDGEMDELISGDGRPVVDVIQLKPEQAEELGIMDKLNSSKDDIILTKPIIRIQNADPIKHLKRNSKIKVPPTRVEDTLHQRFNEIQNKVKKRHLTPYFTTLNFLRLCGQMGFKKLDRQLKAAKELKLRADKTSSTMAAKIAQDTISNEDYAAFWHEQLDYWAENYLWINREGKRMTREELDRELEAYFSQRGNISFTDQEMLDKDLEGYFSKMGISRKAMADREELDADLDNYRNGITTNPKTIAASTTNSTKSTAENFLDMFMSDAPSRNELDEELENYMAEAAERGPSQIDSRMTTPMTPDHDELDLELENYRAEAALAAK